MVINEIVSAIKAEFPDLKVYTDKIAQGVQAPCFIVQLVDLKYNVQNGTRRIEQYTYSVNYLSENRECNDDALSVRIRLCEALSFIGSAHCTSFDVNVEDGVLSIVCSYNIHVFKQREDVAENMDDMNEENEL